MRMSTVYSADFARKFHQESKEYLVADDFQQLKMEFIEMRSLEDPRDWAILDIGCAGGIHTNFLGQTFPQVKEIIGMDISTDLIQIARSECLSPKVKYVVADMHNIPFEKERFDFVFSRNTMHYANSLREIFEGVSRIMKPKARFYFQDVHPVYTLFLKKNKNYEIQEEVSFPMQRCSELAIHPSFTFEDYLKAIASTDFKVVNYEEFYGKRSVINNFRVPVAHGFLLEK